MKVPIPDDWNGADWCAYHICWPDSILWRGILRGLISYPRRGRFWDETTGSILDVQEIGLNIIDANIPLQESIMSCNGAQELALAVRYLADRLFNKPCCDAQVSVAIQGTTPGGEIIYGTEAPGGVENEGTGDPPDGFETWEAYYTHKCASANLIVDALIKNLNFLANVSLVNLTALATLLGAALASIVAFPPAAIPVIIGALIVMGLSIGVLASISGYVSDRKEEFVCDLYNSTTVDEAIDIWIALLNAALSALGIASGLHGAIRTIALALSNTDLLNNLFTATIDISYPGADCSGCEDSGAYVLYPGSPGSINVVDNLDGTYTVTLTSGAYIPGSIEQAVGWYRGDTLIHRVNSWSVESGSWTYTPLGFYVTPPPSSYPAINVPGDMVGVDCVGGFLYSTSAFVVELEIEPQ